MSPIRFRRSFGIGEVDLDTVQDDINSLWKEDIGDIVDTRR